MTLNQVIARIRAIALAHQQVRSFYFGKPSDFLNDKKTLYAGCFVQDQPGEIGVLSKEVKLTFQMFLLDLVNVAANSKENELEVQSDMLEVAKDLVAEMDDGHFTDWAVSASVPVTILAEEFDDLVAGVMVEVTIRTMYDKDVCAVPTDALPGVINNDDMKLMYDIEYISDGTEGSTLNIPTLVGKKILLGTRESVVIYKVSNNPASSEFTWDNTSITLGTPVNPETPERFLFLYRNY